MTDRGDDLVERLAERVGGGARARAVFGKPVERKGVTVIPVARALWGFGGGSGIDPTSGGSGGGGGGFGAVRPIGYIEIRNDRVAFKPIRDWRALGITAAASIAVVAAVTARILRRR